MSGIVPADIAQSDRATILLVDDEPEILTALQDLLEDEYRILTSTSPVAALAILQAEPGIAVIISDQRMPVMTGDVFLARARGISSAPGLLLTGYADIDAVVAAVNNGQIAGYAHKPWEAAALRTMVASAVDRHRLSRMLQAERALLHGMLDYSADAMSFKDRNGCFVRLNAVKASSLGATVALCLGRTEQSFLPPDQWDKISQAEQDVIERCQAAETSEERIGASGTARWIRITRTPLCDAQGAVSVIAIVEHDITDFRQMEMRLRQADKMQALGTMSGGIAHDFNNLLTAILGSLELAARLNLNEPRLTRLLNSATIAAKRGSTLTQRLLSFSHQRELMVRPIDANQLIRDMEDLLVRTLGGVVQVERHLDPDLWPIRVDPDQFELTLLNLGINARDAMQDGGVLSFATRNAHLLGDKTLDLPAGDYVVVSVRDSGTGMPPEVLSRVFEPFFTTKPVGKGTGLGLSIVYGFARQSGGTMAIDSTPGKGTQVELFLPRDWGNETGEQTLAQPSFSAQRPLSVLVVDDDPAVREVTVAFLRELGHATREAGAGYDAIQTLRDEPDFDLVISDMAMPTMSGMDFARQAQAIRPDVPILLVTGYVNRDEIPAGYPILYKPFDQAQLAERIARLVSEPAAPSV